MPGWACQRKSDSAKPSWIAASNLGHAAGLEHLDIVLNLALQEVDLIFEVCLAPPADRTFKPGFEEFYPYPEDVSELVLLPQQHQRDAGALELLVDDAEVGRQLVAGPGQRRPVQPGLKLFIA